MQGKKQLHPQLFYHTSLDALVPADNFYRQLGKNLDLLFLYKATADYYGTEGQESIDPVVFFKILLVGYLNNINSAVHCCAIAPIASAYTCSSVTTCTKNCPLRQNCIGGNTKFKKIDGSIHKPLYDRMHQKLTANQSYHRRLVKRRSATVEPVLGTLINNHSMQRVHTRGMAGANKHVLMAALTYNLKKYLHFKALKLKLSAIALTKPIKSHLQHCFWVLLHSLRAPLLLPVFGI